jgi:putative PIG3 family NAD(P)H quinone oxidoreductase
MAQAVRIREPGGEDVLDVGSIDVRDPGGGELLVKVAAAGLNRADVLQRMGFYPAPPGVPADVPGLELAGTVAAVGPGVTSFAPGDRVMAIVGGGAMATEVVLHEREALRVPDGLDLAQAAAVPEAFLTAYDALFGRADLRLGQRTLIHAVASGVGTAALQLALACGAVAVGTSRSPDKLERCKELGLHHGLLVKDGRFADALRPIGAPHVVLDLVGAAYLEENLRAVAPLGTIVVIGLLGGTRGDVDLALLLRKRATMVGTVMRSRSLEERATLVQAFARDVLPLLASGRVRPVIDEVLPMTEVREAHRRMAGNETFGKLVLRW